jgi:uroporphyrinogen-III decarboxylase
MMTSKERLLTAINRGKPDRLPASIHQWQDYHLRNFMGGATDIEAFRMCGLDAQIQHIASAGVCWEKHNKPELSTSRWKHNIRELGVDQGNMILQHTISTPEGELSFKSGYDDKTTWIIEHMIKNDEDIYLIDKYMPVPGLDHKEVLKIYAALGDGGILRGMVWGEQAGCWQQAAVFMDITQLIYATFDKPEWVHEFLNILLKKKLQFIETMKGAPLELIETGGGASSSTLISPDIHSEFCLPYDRQMHDALHSLNFKTSYHTCGGTLDIEEMIIENGTDVSETLAPVNVGGNQEPWDFKKKVGNRIALIGGLDQFGVLTGGDETLIREKVAKLFEKVGYEGGYICCASDHFFDAPPENLMAFAKAAKDCVY